MKKIIFFLLLSLLFVIQDIKAQLPNGSIAPDFTITDINNQSHQLYDILDSGYSVVIQFFTAYDGPSWNYHNDDGNLKRLWKEHGPDGESGVDANTTDDVFVIMVESSSAATSLDDLYGTGNASYGDWTAGTNFPIAKNSTLAPLFDVYSLPLIYTICPNRILYNSGTVNSDNHYDVVGQCKSAETGKNLSVFDYTGEKTTCGNDTNELKATARFQNMGTEEINTFTAEIFNGTNSIATTQYNGSLSKYEFIELDFGIIEVPANVQLDIKIITNDVLSSDNILSQSIVKVNEATGKMTLKVTTDNFGNQVTWKIITIGSDSTLVSGGPYGSSPQDTYDAMPQDDDTIRLDNDGCYYFQINDSGFDGMHNAPQHDEGPTFFRLLNDNGDTLVEIFGNEYKASIKRKFLYKKTSSVSEKSKPSDFTFFPNPLYNESELTISSNEFVKNVQISVYNVLGMKVVELKNVDLNKGSNTVNINCAELVRGMYTVSIESKSFIQSQNILKIE